MDQVTLVIPPCPKTTRGETSFLEASPTHLLYFNGCTVVLRPLGNVSCLSITHTCAVSAVKFSTGQQQVASIDEKGTLMIHGIQQGKVVHIKTYEECFPNCKAMDWTADNKKLCVVGAGKNKFGKVLTVETGVSVGELSAVTANLTTCSFRPEKPYKLMVGGEEFQVKAYDGPPYKFTCSQKSHSNFINQLKYSPDGETIVSVGSDRKIVLYNGHTATI
jgi:WD40 repeat protein